MTDTLADMRAIKGSLKVVISVAILLAFLTPASTCYAQDVLVGTNIPGMPRGTGKSKPAAPTPQSNQEEPVLAAALQNLNNEARSIGEGRLIWNVISAQVRLQEPILKRQRATTGWNYGELVVANWLAVRSGNSFEKIVSLRRQTSSWSQLARQLRIDPALAATPVNAARASLKRGKNT